MNEDILSNWCHLSLQLLINSDIDSRDGINISTESSYGTKLLNINRPAVHRIHYGKDIRVKIIEQRNHFALITYGILLSSKKKFVWRKRRLLLNDSIIILCECRRIYINFC